LPIAGCCEPVLFEDSFENGPTNWSFSGGSGACKWQVVTNGKSVSAPGALYYGNAAAKNFDCGDNSGKALSTPINIPNKTGLSLKLKAWWATETSSSYDKIFVRIKTETGVTQIADKPGLGGTTNTWHSKSFSMDAYAGKTIQIEIEFDSIDSIANTGEGVYFDDIEIVDPCN